MRVHMCGQRGCHTVVPIKQRYCDVHAPFHKYIPKPVSHEQRLLYYKHYNRFERSEEATEFYSSAKWKRVREYVASRDLYTSAVSGRVIDDHDLIVDHIVPRRLCQNPLDMNNLWCLSKGEHTRKTILEQKIAEKKNGDAILKHATKKWWLKVLREKIN